MKRILLSPPFSNVYTNSSCTNIIGSYTLNKRPGLHRVLTTLKPTRDGWLNNVGLRNPGVSNIRYKKDSILSLFLFNDNDWLSILPLIKEYNFLGIEFNISCPNVNQYYIDPSIIKEAASIWNYVSVKLPHNPHKSLLYKYFDAKAIYHISNTKKTDKGALSGLSLINQNLSTIKEIKALHSDIDIIGGGGIYTSDIAKQYLNAGANYLSLSTSLINIFKINSLIKEILDEC